MGIAAAAGTPIVETLAVALRALSIDKLSLATFPATTGLDDRLRQRVEGVGNTGLLETSQRLGVPLWQLVAASALHDASVGLNPFDLFMSHGVQPNSRTYTLGVHDLISERFKAICEGLQPNEALGISSRVVTGNGVRHLAMMDFCSPKSEKNEEILVSSLRRIGAKAGVIVDSGRSYHYYGWELMTVEQWMSFMGLSLLLAPLTDSRYIGHRLADGESRLRIFSPTRPQPVVRREFAP